MTTSDKADEAVERIVSTGNIPTIDDGYERERIVRGLEDYATYPDSSDIVVERAKKAIEQLTGTKEQ
ncbi:hypothetical protein [Halocatena marina]|uniref:hypothetical protein n=1 Tax=Halocatena marina TaxID=2934937 RepID=UPI00200C0F3D|nr:hypothetical protein [Halocatena marina]